MTVQTAHRRGGGGGLTIAGFPLLELVIALVIVSILTAVAVPAYASARDRALDAAAKDTLARGVVAAYAYYADADTFAGATTAALRRYDAALPADGLTVSRTTATSVCLRFAHRGRIWYRGYPGGTFSRSSCG